MRILSHADAYEVLLLQAGGDGRASALFGESLSRAHEVHPFLVGRAFPDVYLEIPLLGEPFLDVTVLYDTLEAGTRIDSSALVDADALLDWFAAVSQDHGHISFGFELDTKEAALPQAAVHFQHRASIELVPPFCEVVGEPERAGLYLDLAARMPKGWPLSFLGMFRGRADSPLRVCGYLNSTERMACACDPARLSRAFDEVGFSAYDDALLAQATELMARAPGGLDFQFDVYPDGRLGSTFAFDVQFEIQRTQAVRTAFAEGPVADVMHMLEAWGAADERWHLAADAAFARAIPVELEDGAWGGYALVLMPQWAKVRWSDGVLQPSKLYLLAHAGLIEGKGR